MSVVSPLRRPLWHYLVVCWKSPQIESARFGFILESTDRVRIKNDEPVDAISLHPESWGIAKEPVFVDPGGTLETRCKLPEVVVVHPGLHARGSKVRISSKSLLRNIRGLQRKEYPF